MEDGNSDSIEIFENGYCLSNFLWDCTDIWFNISFNTMWKKLLWEKRTILFREINFLKILNDLISELKKLLFLFQNDSFIKQSLLNVKKVLWKKWSVSAFGSSNFELKTCQFFVEKIFFHIYRENKKKINFLKQEHPFVSKVFFLQNGIRKADLSTRIILHAIVEEIVNFVFEKIPIFDLFLSL